jgi:hypothetical protein
MYRALYCDMYRVLYRALVVAATTVVLPVASNKWTIIIRIFSPRCNFLLEKVELLLLTKKFRVLHAGRNVHYRIHNSQPHVPIFSEINDFYAVPFCLVTI